MTQVLTSAEMQAADKRTAEQFGLGFAQLMENAGRAVADFAERLFPEAQRVLAICGKGNNGGDGFVAARHLADRGCDVTVLLLADREDIHGDPAAMLKKFGGKVVAAADIAALESPRVQQLVAQAEVVLDGVFGTGFHPPLEGLAAAARDLINACAARVVSVDLPSGWDADSRDAHADSFRSDAVMTFTAAKQAHVWGELTRGPIVVADIGSPQEAVQSTLKLGFTGEALAKFQTARKRDNNKGNFGHVLVIGGSFGKAGAPQMSSLASMRAGAGLTTAAIVKSMLPTVAAIAPELMTVPLEETADGSVAKTNAYPDALTKLMSKISVVAMGPGLGENPETQDFIHTVVDGAEMPLVLDADGLNAYAGHAEKLGGSKTTRVLTPHPGEMGRLLGIPAKDVQADRENIARDFASKHGVILVLKGWRTLVAHPDGRVAVNMTGNPGQAKGGSGDLLTGLVAGMLAQAHEYGATHGEAVEAAVYLHGLIADFAVKNGDEHTLLCTDTLAYLPEGFRFRVREGGWTWLQGFPDEAAG